MWYLDLFIAVTLVFIVSVVYIQHMSQSRGIQTDLLSKAQTMSGLLMSPGYPLNWNTSTVVIPGVVNDYHINQTKLNSLYDLPHKDLVYLFQVENNVYIYLEQNANPIIVIGKNATGKEPTSLAQNIAHVQRVALYNNKPAILHVITWA